MAILNENGLSHTIEKIVNLLKGKSSTDHKHTKSDITDFPTLGTASSKDVASSGNASASQVVMGNDTRLSDARKASDVYPWAKASTKPSYTASEVGAYTKTETDTKLNGKANSSHTHGNGDITSLDAGKITSGTISIDRLPQGALERLTIVADDTARFKLTSATIQNGDTVKVTSTGKMYYVVDETKLSTEAGYEVYAAGTAASVPWSGVTNKPSTYTPSSHTHTKSQITDFPTSMPANGGNSSTVNGHTVNSDVPSGAKFTDTVYIHPQYSQKTSGFYKFAVDGGGHVSSTTAVTKSDITSLGIASNSVATASENGLMSSTQFKNLKDLISTNTSVIGTSFPGTYGRILKLSSPINGTSNDAYAIGINTAGRLYTYFGNNGSTTAAWKTLLLKSDITTANIYITSLSLGSMTLKGNYDGDAPQVAVPCTSTSQPLCIIPRSSGSADVCWIDCYIDSNSRTKVRLKNTTSNDKTFTPSVYVIYKTLLS